MYTGVVILLSVHDTCSAPTRMELLRARHVFCTNTDGLFPGSAPGAPQLPTAVGPDPPDPRAMKRKPKRIAAASGATF